MNTTCEPPERIFLTRRDVKAKATKVAMGSIVATTVTRNEEVICKRKNALNQRRDFIELAVRKVAAAVLFKDFGLIYFVRQFNLLEQAYKSAEGAIFFGND
jgi:hypothetical protein